MLSTEKTQIVEACNTTVQQANHRKPDIPGVQNRAFLRGLVLTVRAVPWILRERDPMNSLLDADLRTLDARRFATRRPLLTRRDWQPGDPLLIPEA